MKPARVLIPQMIAKQGIERLKAAGCKVVMPEQFEQKSLLRLAADCDAILVRTAVISRELIENAPNLKVIARHGIGVDNIDLQAAAERGVYVCNVPYANVNSVAEHVVGMMISLAHQILRADKALRQGKFDVRHTYIGTELKGKTLGLIGFGNIGKSVARKCALGLEMRIMAYDPYVQISKDMDYVRMVDSIDDILAEADFISLHLPYTPEMHHLFDKESFAKMKRNCIFINCARGGLVDEDALYEALKTGEIAGAGLDVFEQEPTPKHHPLWDLDNVIVTPHMAAHTEDSLVAMAVGAADEILRVLNGQEPISWVNKKWFAQNSVEA
ncbi:hypothetical protein BSNK01_05150 [Bacillaceae bacterium]